MSYDAQNSQALIDRTKRLVARWAELKGSERVSPDEDEELHAQRLQELWLTPPRPYPGLRSFAPDDAGLFFARDDQVRDLMRRLADSNIMVVLGGSGSGKSSLVRAGLIPKLSGADSVPGQPGRWYVIEMRPGEDPNLALLSAVYDQLVFRFLHFTDPGDQPGTVPLGRRAVAKALSLDEHADLEVLQDAAWAWLTGLLFPNAEPGAGHQAIKDADLDIPAVFRLAGDVLDRLDWELSLGIRAGAPNLLLLLDQFEEAFRPEVSAAGRDNLVQLVKAMFKYRPASLFLSLTLRSEELHRCAEAGLANIITSTAFLLGPLDDDKARREIIVAPAAAVFRDWIWGDDDEASGAGAMAPFDDDAFSMLMEETQFFLSGLGHKSDHLPLLQHALQRIWDGTAERWRTEVNLTPPRLDLRIGTEDILRAIPSANKPGWLTRCLNDEADKTGREATEAVVKQFGAGGAKRPEMAAVPRDRAEMILRTTFIGMARKDDGARWSRRFITARRVAELLDEPTRSDRIYLPAVMTVLSTFRNAGYLRGR